MLFFYIFFKKLKSKSSAKVGIFSRKYR